MKVSDLKAYKDSLYVALSRDLSEFEKNFLLIAGGIFAFSLTFIKDIVKLDTARQLFLLFLGWGLIVISIGLMMCAFLYSSVSSDKLWKCTDDFLIKNKLFKSEDELNDAQINEIKGSLNNILEKSKAILRKIRSSAVIIFILGLILFSSFISYNMIQERSKKNLDESKNKSTILILNDIEVISSDTLLIIRNINGKNKK